MIKFKNSEHEDRFFNYCKKFMDYKIMVGDSPYYLSLVFLISSLDYDFSKYIKNGFKGDDLLNDFKDLPDHEMILIKLGLHLFNYRYEFNYSISELFNYFGKENKKIILKSLELRFLRM